MARSYRLLGTLEIEEDGRPSPLMSNAKGCALVAYLIASSQPRSREAMADLLWDADSTGRALGNLRSLLNRIRKLAPELTVTRQSVSFHQGPHTYVDLNELNDVLTAGDPERLDSGLQLYRGDILSGLYLDDAPRFHEWLLLTQERLRVRVLTAHEQLCRIYHEQGGLAQALDVARRWSNLDPLDEEALRQLLTLLALNGLTGSALQQYETSRQTLWRELGLEPEAATTELVEQIRRGQLKSAQTLPADPGSPQGQGSLLAGVNSTSVDDSSSLDTGHIKRQQQKRDITPAGFTLLEALASADLPEPGPLPANAIMPYRRNEDFVGRRADLLRIAAAFAEAQERGRRPVVAITGIGGLGKTQTAVEFCYRYGRIFPGGVFWLNFGQAQTVAEEVATIGSERGLGLFRELDQLSMADRTGLVQRAWQEPVRRLLIFDSCEDEALLEKWLPVTGGCHVLLTSRHGAWQRTLGVTTVPLDTLEPQESSLLLQRLATHVNESEALQIGREVDHLPLALQLAGSFLGHYHQITPAAYVTQLQGEGLLHHPSMQGRGAGQSPAGHELNLTRMFTFSWNRLEVDDRVDAIARRLLACAASLAPAEPIPKEWLQAAIDGDADDLASILLAEDGLLRLVQLGFLRSSGETVILHRLLALFTREANSAEELRVAQTLVASLLARRLSDHFEREGHLSTLPIAASHLRYVSEISLTQGLPMAASLATLLGVHLMNVGAYRDAEQILLRAIAAARASVDLQAQARGLIALSSAQESLGHYETSLRSAQEAVSLLKELDSPDPAGLAEALYQQGRILHRMEKEEAALEAAAEGFDLSRSAGLEQASARFLDLMGVVNYYNLGQYEIAQRQLEDSPAICRQLGNRLGESYVLNHMGENARLQGDFALAARHYEEALAIARRLNNQSRANLYLSNLCGALVGLGQFERAAADLEALLADIRHDWFGLSEAYRFLSVAYLGQGKTTQALSPARRALALANHSNLVETSRAWRVLGLVAAKSGELIRPDAGLDRLYDAAACFRHSLELLEVGNVGRDRAITIWHWGQYETGRGNRQQGQAMAQEARDIFTRLNLPRMIIWLEDSYRRGAGR